MQTWIMDEVFSSVILVKGNDTHLSLISSAPMNV